MAYLLRSQTTGSRSKLLARLPRALSEVKAQSFGFIPKFGRAEVRVCRATALLILTTPSEIEYFAFFEYRISETLDSSYQLPRKNDVIKADITFSEDEKPKQERSDPRRSEATPTSTSKR